MIPLDIGCDISRIMPFLTRIYPLYSSSQQSHRSANGCFASLSLAHAEEAAESKSRETMNGSILISSRMTFLLDQDVGLPNRNPSHSPDGLQGQILGDRSLPATPLSRHGYQWKERKPLFLVGPLV
jgi:hypothetical protein